jgi:hypothetical protein
MTCCSDDGDIRIRLKRSKIKGGANLHQVNSAKPLPTP